MCTGLLSFFGFLRPVIAEVMLCGRYPFDGQKQALDDQIRTASYSMSGGVSVEGIIYLSLKSLAPVAELQCSWLLPDISLGPPVVPFCRFFFGGGFQNRLQKKGFPYSSALSCPWFPAWLP